MLEELVVVEDWACNSRREPVETCFGPNYVADLVHEVGACDDEGPFGRGIHHGVGALVLGDQVAGMEGQWGRVRVRNPCSHDACDRATCCLDGIVVQEAVHAGGGVAGLEEVVRGMGWAVSPSCEVGSCPVPSYQEIPPWSREDSC